MGDTLAVVILSDFKEKERMIPQVVHPYATGHFILVGHFVQVSGISLANRNNVMWLCSELPPKNLIQKESVI